MTEPNTPVIAIIAPGAMGAAIGARFAHTGYTVLTDLTRRSQASAKRAQKAGIKDVPLQDLVAQADWVLSVLPPSEALALARSFRAARDKLHPEQRKHTVYVDCNAVNPSTAQQIGTVIDGAEDMVYLDASIIGGPPSMPDAAEKGNGPTIYASAQAKDEETLKKFEKIGEESNLKIVVMGEGAGIGAASALKMGYAGITKGVIGLFISSILSTNAFSPSTSQALLHELQSSQPHLFAQFLPSVSRSIPKAYRFVGEMEEIANFVGPGPERAVYDGLARLYERVERSVQNDGEGDVQTLKDFVQQATSEPKENR